ncbi:DapH/DapD/GlmU-related protein [Zunongwangia sp. HRR-M8]|uniref:DapH/DapD/GlmU-related protein n=1 Tax=Zunongwangia sp. HRR-M8 TaxID=3015170 RepID=UPI0022DDF671|nr:DapH/DapD/GlmU-related protein [Zunongwangia sp. HRR-M8]WBL22052.1 DapH/DapD/GlmU-related protein [Zunongwangia sp. HRR-M8]
MFITKIKLIIFAVNVVPHLLVTYFSSEKEKIRLDLEAFAKIQKKNIHGFYGSLMHYLINCKEFRNVFYMRVGPRKTHLLGLLLKPAPLLFLGVKSENCGGGVFVQHGNSTIVLAKSIGESFWVNQNVTVGWTKLGCPTIGDNVRIGTGAVVIGPITIGNNVTIGAGAIVAKNVPSNCTIVSPHAYILNQDGVRVNKPL